MRRGGWGFSGGQGLSTGLVILKFLGIACAAGFGVLALLTEYRDDEGSITRWGRLALIGVILSGILTATTQCIELVLQRTEAENAQARALAQLRTNEQLLVDISRGLNPLNDVRATFWLSVSLDHPDLQSFVERFDSEISPLILKWESGSHPDLDPSTRAYPTHKSMGKVYGVGIPHDSPLFPCRLNEEFAYTVFTSPWVMMCFYAEPIPINEFLYYGEDQLGRTGSAKSPDITMLFQQSSPWDLSLECWPKAKRFVMRGNNHRSDEHNWGGTGRLISVLDLAGAQVFIMTDHTATSEERDKRLHLRVDRVILNIGSTKGLCLGGGMLQQHAHPFNGETIYEYRFPKNFRDVERALRSW